MGMGQIVDYSQFILQIEKAIANGVASLDSNAKVPKNQISLNASDVGAIAVEADPTVSSFTKGLTTNDSILTALNASSGLISSDRLPSYVDDVLSYAAIVNFPVAGETSKIYVAEDTNKIYRWSGSSYVEISSAATADTALKLSTPRTISKTGDATYSVSFDGSTNVSSAITLANTGVAAGTYNALATQVRPFTVDAKGRITGVGTPVDITPPWSAITGTPTTLSGYGITDALPLSGGTVTGVTTFSNATSSTSTTTGAVVVLGGVGVGGAVFANSYNLIPIGRGAGNVSTNTAVGISAGRSNTTGNFNSFVGVSAGDANTTGSSNSFVGTSAGQSNTTGNNNSFVGASAGRSNATGSNNSFVGVSAGRFIADGVTGLTVINKSCYFGMNTKGTQNATNENVFGFNATGNGSNTVTIGDSAITNTYLRGVVSTDSTATSTSTTTGAIRAASLGITGAIFADSVNATSKIAVGPNFSISSISGYSNISLGNNLNSEYGQSSIEIPTNTLYGGINQHHTGVKLVCGEMGGWGTAKFKIYISNYWSTYNPIACFSVGDDGGTFLGSAKATSFFVGANQVVSARRTGYTPSTGTLSREAFNTETVTLLELARQFHALRTDLTTHGLIGA